MEKEWNEYIDLIKRLGAEEWKILWAAERIAELEAAYNDLLYQVQNKIPGETRHETAKRIIHQHENQNNPPAVKQMNALNEALGEVDEELDGLVDSLVDGFYSRQNKEKGE